jgi:hypothetical protein
MEPTFQCICCTHSLSISEKETVHSHCWICWSNLRATAIGGEEVLTLSILDGHSKPKNDDRGLGESTGILEPDYTHRP